MPSITSLLNPLIKEFSRLHYKKYRDDTGTFLLEGPCLIYEALNAKINLKYIAYTESFKNSNEGENILGMLLKINIPSFKVTDLIMKKIGTLTVPPGIIGIAYAPKIKISFAKNYNLLLLLDGIQDPGNLGTIIRTALGGGCNGLIATSKTVDFYNPKAVRGSMGALFYLSCQSGWSWEEVKQLKEQDISIIVADPKSKTPYWDANLSNSTLLVLGSEGHGPSKKVLNIADKTVAIPLEAKFDSLNVAIAAGILIFEARRQRLQYLQRLQNLENLQTSQKSNLKKSNGHSLANLSPICYNQFGLRTSLERSGQTVQTLDIFWQIFQVTGSVSAYLMYKRLQS